MSSKNKREADKIIRESLKGTQQNLQMPQLQMQPFAPMTPMGMPFPTGPFGFPTPQYPQFPHQNQHLPVQTRGNNGPCFNCNQSGHVTRNCPMGQRNSRGGGKQQDKLIVANDFLGRKKDNWTCLRLERTSFDLVYKNKWTWSSNFPPTPLLKSK